MLNLLLLVFNMDCYEDKVRKVFNELGRLQMECPYGSFSEYGLIEPFLLLCLLKMAVEEDRTGDEAVERVRHELEKNDPEKMTAPDGGGKDSVLRLHKEDMEKLLGPFATHFRTSLYVFDGIARDYATEYTGMVSMEEINLTSPITSRRYFETALRLAYHKRVFSDDKSVNPSIAELARDILEVKNGESFMDFMCGTCLSTSVIIGDSKNVDIRLVDRDRNCCDYAEFYSRFSGLKPIITCEDSLAKDSSIAGYKADKIFVTSTIGERVTLYNPKFSIRSETPASVIKAADSLKEHGKAVIVLNSTYAFGTSFEEVRNYIVDNRYVSAVLLLPGLFSRTNLPAVILVLTKEENDDILMVDWRDKEKDEKYFYYEKRYMTLVFRPDKEKELVKIIKNRSGEGSRVVSYDEVKANGCNLLPSVYVEEKGETKERSMSQIDDDIYEALRSMEMTIRALKRGEYRR